MKKIQFISLMKPIALTSCLLLAACSFFSPVKTDPVHTYVLKRVPDVSRAKFKRRGVLLVLTPDTAPYFNTTRMAYTKLPYQVGYFGQNQWAETPSQMLRPLLIKALRSSNTYKAVVGPPYLGRYQYVLQTQVIEIIQDYTVSPAQFRLVAALQLMSSSNQVIATKQIAVSEPILPATPYGGVLAANRATSQFLSEAVAFVALRR